MPDLEGLDQRQDGFVPDPSPHSAHPAVRSKDPTKPRRTTRLEGRAQFGRATGAGIRSRARLSRCSVNALHGRKIVHAAHEQKGKAGVRMVAEISPSLPVATAETHLKLAGVWGCARLATLALVGLVAAGAAGSLLAGVAGARARRLL
jgi:hypothetical protein